MNNVLSKLKYGWKNVCKLWLQEPTPYASPACSKPLDLRSLGVGGWRRQTPHGPDDCIHVIFLI
jgi:hypothetical protein